LAPASQRANTTLAFDSGGNPEYLTDISPTSLTRSLIIARLNDDPYQSREDISDLTSLHPSQTNCLIGRGVFDDSGKTNTTCYRNTALGALAMALNGDTVTAGGSNVAIGFASQESSVESSGNTSVGALSLNAITGVDSSHNVVVGYRGLAVLVNGTQNEVYGFQGANSLTDGDNNHLFGENIASSLVTGSGNHLYGYQAGFAKLRGSFAHGFGYQVLFAEGQCAITAITKAASAVITSSQVSVDNPFSVGCPSLLLRCRGYDADQRRHGSNICGRRIFGCMDCND
jgi:hypothetical protein